MTKLRAAVIGLRMGDAHARAHAQNPDVELVALCDTNEQTLEALGTELEVSTLTTDFNTLLDMNLDVINICTPDHFHASLTVAFLEASTHVLCEKPMAPTLDECYAMVEASRKTDKKLMIGQSYRYQDKYRAIKNCVLSGELGTPYLVESEYWNNLEGVGGEGNWRNNPRIRHPFVGGCHAMDLCRWIAGEVVEVEAYANHLSFIEQPTDDCIIAQVRFASGCLGRVLVSSGCKRPFLTSLNVHGTKGTIEDFALSHDKAENFTPLPESPANNSIDDENAAFIQAIKTDGPVPVDAVDGFGTMAACFAVVESSLQGGQIKVARV